jgi:Holliday junction resolvase RusA-like endonuclease
MTFVINFPVFGNPIPKSRPRFTFRGRTYTPARTVEYEKTVREAAMQAMGASEALETPVSVFIHVTYAIPQSYTKKRKEACLNGFERPMTRNFGDLDNVVKSLTDGMNEIVYKDDSQIVGIHATKVFGTESLVQIMVKEELP